MKDTTGIDVELLRRTTERVKNEIRIEGSLRSDEKKAHDVQKAREILKNLKACATVASEKGLNEVKVMALKGRVDFDRMYTNKLPASELIGAARLVYSKLEGENLKLDIRFWHDGGGMDSGFDLWLLW